VLERAESPDRVLAAIFTLGGPESLQEVRVGGSLVGGTAMRESDAR